MIYLLQPPSAGLRSGGYRYNAAIAAGLQRDRIGRIVEVEACDLQGQAERLAESDPGCVLVFDSLYLTELAPRPWLSRLTTPTRLLLHYLPSRNPALDASERAKFEAAEAAWLRAVDSVLCAARSASEWLRARHPDLRVSTVRPGIDRAFVDASQVSPHEVGMGRASTDQSTETGPRQSPGTAPAGSSTPTIAMVGNLLPDKGQLEVAEILAGLAQRGQPSRLLLIGDDSLRADYVAEIEACAGAGFEVERSAWVDDVPERLAAADVFVCASRHECFSTAAVEAAATGMPLLSYAVGDLEDWVDGEPGVRIVAPGDHDGMKAALAGFVEEAAAGALTRRVVDPRAFPTWDDAQRAFVDACRPVRASGVALYASCTLPTRHGFFDIDVYRLDGGEEALMIRMGELREDPAPFIRIHSECFTGEVLESLRCDCKGQLDLALAEVAERKCGAVIYLRQEGRGIGLGNKVRAYAEQSRGADTIQANEILGFPADLRDFKVAASILEANGIRRVQINTNNPDKIRALEQAGIEVERVVASLTLPNPHNVEYLRTKSKALGHERLSSVLPEGRNGKQCEGLGLDPKESLVVLDLDGVIQFGRKVPEHAHELLRRLREAGYALRFLTNDGFNSRRSRCEQLHEAGVEISIDELYTASSLTARYVRERIPGSVLALVGGPARDEFEDLELSNASDASCVVVGDWFDDYDRSALRAAYTALERGAELIAMHRKRSWASEGVGEHSIDIGFWVAGLEYCCRREATVVAKPSAYAYTTILEDSGFDAERCLMVSDEIDPDLLGAERLGLRTLLAAGGRIPRELFEAL